MIICRHDVVMNELSKVIAMTTILVRKIGAMESDPQSLDDIGLYDELEQLHDTLLHRWFGQSYELRKLIATRLRSNRRHHA